MRQHRVPGNRSINTWAFKHKTGRVFQNSEKRKEYSVNLLGQETIHVKMKLDPYFIPHAKMKSRWIKDLNMGHKRKIKL